MAAAEGHGTAEEGRRWAAQVLGEMVATEGPGGPKRRPFAPAGTHSSRPLRSAGAILHSQARRRLLCRPAAAGRRSHGTKDSVLEPAEEHQNERFLIRVRFLGLDYLGSQCLAKEPTLRRDEDMVAFEVAAAAMN